MGKKVKGAFSAVTGAISKNLGNLGRTVGVLPQKQPEIPAAPAVDTSALQEQARAQTAAAEATARAAAQQAEQQRLATERTTREAAAAEAERQSAATAAAQRQRDELERTRDLTAEEITQRAGEAGTTGLMAPRYAGVQSGMTPLQQRTAIATRGVSGDLGTDPEAFKYFRNQSFASLGQGGEPTPIERQYVDLFGERSSGSGTPAYLSAIERIYRRFH